MKDSWNCALYSNWVMRIVLALVFITAGYGKLAVHGVAGFAATFNLPEVIAWLVALGELGAGVGIIIGGLISKMDPKSFLTRASGAVIVVIMLGAIFIAKWANFSDGFLAGVGSMYADLALLALGFHYLAVGNATTKK